MKNESLFSQKVRALNITFDHFHVMCKLREVDGSPAKPITDLWYISATYGEKVYHGEYTTGIGSRYLFRDLKKERGGYWHEARRELIKDDPHELIRRGYLFLPNEVSRYCQKPEQREERMFKLGVDFLHSSFSDASSVVCSFKSWASDSGYNPDSLSALQIYLKCQDIRDKLLQTFGSELFNELLSLEH